MNTNLQTATLAGGCFWCLEAVYDEIKGVHSVESGYAGGHMDNPTYRAVCNGDTGHAEVIQVHFDPNVVSYRDLLNVLFAIHDPTTLNRQGADVGTQYRSAIFYVDKQQEEAARKAIMKWTPAFKNPIVTELAPLKQFYRAEEYHQNYASENPNQSYIKNVSMPRFEKFKRACKLKLKE